MIVNNALEITQLDIKPMGLGHINEIVEIEDLVFPTPWSKQSFIYELVHNDHAYYLVALYQEKVVGYGGFWLVFDEAHVTNIGIHPEFQGRQIGQILLTRLIKLAAGLGGERMTLEVRPSNDRALKLYHRLGFQQQGIRKGYYSDTKEDAIIMWLDTLELWRKQG